MRSANEIHEESVTLDQAKVGVEANRYVGRSAAKEETQKPRTCTMMLSS